MAEIQSIYFMDNEWTQRQAESWILNHDIIPLKPMHKDGNKLRFRISNPLKYQNFITKIGCDKKNRKKIYFVFGIE